MSEPAEAKCLHQLFEEQVERTPDAVAVVFEGQPTTYRELNTRANHLAGHLHSLGVGPEVIVGLCTERSLEMVTGMLGILKAGGAYLPLDPHYPEERLNFILKDSRAGIIVTDESLTRLFRDLNPSCLFVMAGSGGTSNPFNLLQNCSTANLAYVIYTSGSTGTPKGVAIEHASAVSFLHWVRETFTDEELSGVLAVTSICFDISVFEIFGPLCWGGKIILAKSALHGMSDQDWSGVRLINTVPSLLQAWLKTRRPPPSILTVNLAGEFLKPSLVDAIYQQWPVQRVNDLYGPTETTIYSTWTTREPGKPASIGKPISNTQVYILDVNLKPVPSGTPGNLYISGAGVARGYLHRPEMTAERFLPDPFCPKPGERIYKTGDRVRYLPDGNIEYLGRFDHQVKIRGHRIELGEIEAVVSEHPQVGEAAVLAMNEDNGEQSLVAFVVAREETSLTSAGLRQFLKEKLPDPMIPARFVMVPALPLAPNGKVDRKALERLEGQPLPFGEEYRAPRTRLECELVEIWQTVLRREQVGIEDNFFEVGGDSIQLAIVHARVVKAAGRDLPITDLFAHPSIRSLAGHLEAGAPGNQDDARTRALKQRQALAARNPSVVRR